MRYSDALLAVAASILALLYLFPLLLGDRASAINMDRAFASPSAACWLGTDALGRDILAHTLVAAPLSVTLALLAVATACGVGIPLGGLTGIGPAWSRDALGRFIHVLLSFPSMLAALVIVTLLGSGGVNAAVAVGLAMAPGFARTTQTLTVAVAGSDYVAAAKVLGVPAWRRFTHYVLPNIAGPLAVKIAAEVGAALVIIASFSFLGFGVQPPDDDWGRMLAQGLRALYTTPLAALAPGVAITTTGVVCNWLSDRLIGNRWMARHSVAGQAATPVQPDSVRSPTARWFRKTGDPRHANATIAPESATSAPAAAPDTAVSVRGLSVHYGDVLALEDINLDIAAGEIVGLVGESGSGKTTLALALAGLASNATVQAARLEIAGLPVSRLSIEERARLYGLQVGFVFQDALSAFNPLLATGRQIAERLEVHAAATRHDAARSTLEILSDVGIDDPRLRARQRPRQLSGGLRQRSLIAMGLVTRPRLLIADEPTTALDVTIQAKVLKVLQTAARERKTAILFVSHDLAVVTELCDRIVVLYAGQIVEIVSAQTLASGGARHPYTRALIDCFPGYEPRPRLASIPGAGGAVDSTAIGCRFATRCTLVTAVCRTRFPALTPTGNGDAVACWATEVTS